MGGRLSRHRKGIVRWLHHRRKAHSKLALEQVTGNATRTNQ